jgi:hypothetical protein
MRQVKWLKILSTVSWATGLSAWCILAWIESSALHQPTSPTAIYPYPHNVKGRIRYFTPVQHRLQSIAEPGFIASGAFFFVFGALWLHLDRQTKERAVRRALERDGDI